MARQPVSWPAEESDQPSGGGVIAVLNPKRSQSYRPFAPPSLSAPVPAGLTSSLNGRIRSISFSPLPVAAALVFVLIILLNLFWVIDHPASPTDLGSLKDLGSFLHSGAAHREGLNPYAYHPQLEPLPISREGLNLNPPISVYAFDLASRFDPSLVKAGFIAISCLAYFGAVFALMRAYPEKRTLLVGLAVLALAGFWHMLWYLQLYAPLLLAVVGAWLLLRDGRTLWAGVLIGLVIALKPNYAVVPLILLAAGHYRVAIAAVATAAGVSAVPLILDGPRIYEQWLELSMHFKGLTWTSNASLASAGGRIGADWAGTAAAVIVLFAVLYTTWRIKPPALTAMACGLLTVLLLGPVSWAGYTLFLLPFLFARKWDRVTWAAVFLLAAPFSPDGAISSATRTSSGLGLSIPPVRSIYESLQRASVWLAGAAGDALSAVTEPMGWLWTAPMHFARHVAISTEPLASALLASVYVWAVLLLLVRLMWEQKRDRAALVPYRVDTGTPARRIR